MKVSWIIGNNGIPRRCDLNRNHTSELAIRAAIREVEQIGCDVELTNIVVELDKLRERVADYLERDADQGEIPSWAKDLI